MGNTSNATIRDSQEQFRDACSVSYPDTLISTFSQTTPPPAGDLWKIRCAALPMNPSFCRRGFNCETWGETSLMKRWGYHVLLSWRHETQIHSLKLTACPWKLMVGILLSFWGPAYFQGCLLLVLGREMILGNQPESFQFSCCLNT